MSFAIHKGWIVFRIAADRDYYKHEYQQCIVRQMPDGLIKNLDIGK